MLRKQVAGSRGAKAIDAQTFMSFFGESVANIARKEKGATKPEGQGALAKLSVEVPLLPASYRHRHEMEVRSNSTSMWPCVQRYEE